MCPYVACLRSNQNNGGTRAGWSASSAAHNKNSAGALYLYVAVSKKRFKTKGRHFWMASSSKNSHRGLLSLGLAPTSSPDARLKIQRVIEGAYNSRFFLNNTFSIDNISKALTRDSVQKTLVWSSAR